jgi:hypothetical protein
MQVKSVSDSALAAIRVNGIADTDVSIGEDVGAEPATVDESAQHTLRRESLQVGARLTQPLPEAFDVSDTESATDKAVEIDAAGDQVPASFAVFQPTAIW